MSISLSLLRSLGLFVQFCKHPYSDSDHSFHLTGIIIKSPRLIPTCHYFSIPTNITNTWPISPYIKKVYIPSTLTSVDPSPRPIHKVSLTVLVAYTAHSLHQKQTFNPSLSISQRPPCVLPVVRTLFYNT